jgi:hypothetical protein
MKGHVGGGSSFNGFKALIIGKLSRSYMSQYISTVICNVQERLLEMVAFDVAYSAAPLVKHQT